MTAADLIFSLLGGTGILVLLASWILVLLDTGQMVRAAFRGRDSRYFGWWRRYPYNLLASVILLPLAAAGVAAIIAGFGINLATGPDVRLLDWFIGGSLILGSISMLIAVPLRLLQLMLRDRHHPTAPLAYLNWVDVQVRRSDPAHLAEMEVRVKRLANLGAHLQRRGSDLTFRTWSRSRGLQSTVVSYATIFNFVVFLTTVGAADSYRSNIAGLAFLSVVLGSATPFLRHQAIRTSLQMKGQVLVQRAERTLRRLREKVTAQSEDRIISSTGPLMPMCQRPCCMGIDRLRGAFSRST